MRLAHEKRGEGNGLPPHLPYVLTAHNNGGTAALLRVAAASLFIACEQPRVPTHPLPLATSWQLRFCNDTSSQIERLYFDADGSAGGLRASGCSAYMDGEHLARHEMLRLVDWRKTIAPVAPETWPSEDWDAHHLIAATMLVHALAQKDIK